MDLDPLAAAVAGGLGLVSGALVPRLVAAVPEPEPEEPDADADADADADEPEEAKELYVDVAARPGLLWKCAVAGLLSAAVLGLVLGWSWGTLVVLPLVPVSVALAVIDWRTRLLPTWLIAPAYVVVVVLILAAWLGGAPDRHDLARAALGWLAYGGMFFLLWVVYPRGLGYGDVRLSGLLGLALGWVGWSQLLLGIWFALLLGGVLGAAVALVRRRRDNPFGPFMLLGALVGLVVAPVIQSTYGG